MLPSPPTVVKNDINLLAACMSVKVQSPTHHFFSLSLCRPRGEYYSTYILHAAYWVFTLELQRVA